MPACSRIFTRFYSNFPIRISLDTYTYPLQGGELIGLQYLIPSLEGRGVGSLILGS